MRGGGGPGGPLDVEDLAVVLERIQDGRAPLEPAALSVHRFSRLSERGIERHSPGQRAVELLRERDRGAVRDLVLHGHDRRNPLPDERLGDARRRIAGRRAAAFARVEHDQPQRREVVEQRAHLAAAHRPATALRVFEDEHALAGAFVVRSVPDEMEDVISALAKLRLERRERASLHAIDRQLTALLQFRHGLPEVVPLALSVEASEVGWIGHHDQQPQRQRRGEVRHGVWRCHVVDNGRLRGEREEALEVRRVEIFPGHRRDRSTVQPHAKARIRPAALSVVSAAFHVAGEHGAEQTLAECPGRFTDAGPGRERSLIAGDSSRRFSSPDR